MLRERVELAVPWAVHWLDRHLPLLVLGHEHVSAVLVPVTGGRPQGALVQQRRLDLDVTALAVHLPAEGDQRVENLGPSRQPERRPGRNLGEREQAQLRTELAVVARARLLQTLEVRLEI